MAGLFCGAVCAHRVVVFIDYQNVYHLARSAFGHEGNPDKNVGHVHPPKVGELLCDLGRSSLADRELAGVRVYQGLPDARSGADLVRFTSRQTAGWQRSAGVVVKTRPLVYRQSTGGAEQCGERRKRASTSCSRWTWWTWPEPMPTTPRGCSQPTPTTLPAPEPGAEI